MNTGMPHPPGAAPTTGKNEITDSNGSSLRHAGSSSAAEDPLAFCEKHISAMKRKADHNKQESLWFFYLVISPSLAAPLFAMPKASPSSKSVKHIRIKFSSALSRT
jgi:hypothetical protein